jgi:hypothetical protein
MAIADAEFIRLLKKDVDYFTRALERKFDSERVRSPSRSMAVTSPVP